jgi:hypothetical protein
MAEAEWLLQVAAALAALMGFAWLALAMDVHWKQVHGGAAPPTDTFRSLRFIGGAALLVSGVLCFAANRPSMAILVWIMILAASAPTIAFILAWRPNTLRWLWPAT